jgi:hypothetical protein
MKKMTTNAKYNLDLGKLPKLRIHSQKTSVTGTTCSGSPSNQSFQTGVKSATSYSPPRIGCFDRIRKHSCA